MNNADRAGAAASPSAADAADNVNKEASPLAEDILDGRYNESTDSDDVQEKQELQDVTGGDDAKEDLQDVTGGDDAFVDQGSPHPEKSPATAPIEAEALIIKSPEKLVSTSAALLLLMIGLL